MDIRTFAERLNVESLPSCCGMLKSLKNCKFHIVKCTLYFKFQRIVWNDYLQRQQAVEEYEHPAPCHTPPTARIRTDPLPRGVNHPSQEIGWSLPLPPPPLPAPVSSHLAGDHQGSAKPHPNRQLPSCKLHLSLPKTSMRRVPCLLRPDSCLQNRKLTSCGVWTVG